MQQSPGLLHQKVKHHTHRLIHPQKQLSILPTRTSHTFWNKAEDSITFSQGSGFRELPGRILPANSCLHDRGPGVLRMHLEAYVLKRIPINRPDTRKEEKKR